MNNKNNSDQIRSDYLLSNISNLANKLDVLKWDLGASFSRDNSVQVENGEAKQLKSSQRSSITVRVWNSKGTIGITSTSDLSEKGLERSLEGAYQASLFGNPKEVPQFSKLSQSALAEIKRPIRNNLGINNLFNKLIKAEKKLLDKNKHIKAIPYNGLAESNFQRIYLNSDGASRLLLRSQATIYLFARAEEAGRKPRSSGAVRINIGADELDIDECIEETALKTISHLNYEAIDTGKYLVCFTPEAFLELIGAFSSLFNARSIIDGTSLSSKESLGKQISVPNLTIYDNGLSDHNITGSTFDGEGTPTRSLCIIENGVLKNLIHSESTARQFNVQPTGHAGLGAKASVSPDWLEISKSDTHIKLSSELNHQTNNDTYILIDSLNALHAGVKATQGSFSLPFDGWLMKNGEKISIEAATVAGDIRYVLNNIVSIEDEIVPTHQGSSPHIWVDSLSITGEA